MKRLWPVRPPSAGWLAGLTVVWTVAWSAPLGQIYWDTKYDLLIDPWGFLARSLHLWDPQITWGGLANQGYGYLFPMGPFFGLLSAVLPVWAVQRLWWMVLLTAGFVGAAGLLRALGFRSEAVRVVGALSWVLTPKVVSSVAVLSAEIQPQILAPLILWPVVLGWQRRLGPGRAAALSGLAVLGCGGVNASAVLLAVLPTGLFLVTRHRWWRLRLTWYWACALIAATAWWVGPLLLMARYASPFMSWIETSAIVSGPIGMLDVIRGTTQWLGHLLTPGGAWWPGGYELAASPWLIVLTTMVAAAGVSGLAHRDVPLRHFLWLSLGSGLLLMSLPHAGPAASPLEEVAREALDGPLSPFRNIHKADLLVRLPLMIGLAHFVTVVAAVERRRLSGRSRTSPRVTVGLTAVAIVAAAAPGFTGAAVHRGGHEEVPHHWVQVGEWLDATMPEEGTALLVPAANFAEFRWGRSIDEPLRSLTSAQFAVRDAIPLAPAGTIRLLDAVESRLQTGRPLGGAAAVLRASGVRFLVVRNDLAASESGQPPVELARSSVRATPGIKLVAGFGKRFEDVGGNRIHPVEIYEIDGRVAAPFEIWDLGDVVGANGATDDLLTLADAGLPGRPVIFDGDRSQHVQPGRSVVTDGLRTRHRFFGGVRGQDATATQSESEGVSVRDYLPWPTPSLRSFVVHRGIARVSASSSLAQDQTFVGLQAAMRPFAAIDGDAATGWLTMWDPSPTLTVELDGTRAIEQVTITPFADHAGLPAPVSPATQVRITTDAGHVDADLDAGPTAVDLPAGDTTAITIEITATGRGAPRGVVTGLAEVTIPGMSPVELLRTPNRPPGTSPDVIALGAGTPGRDGCYYDGEGLRCLARQTVAPEAMPGVGYLLSQSASGMWRMSGSLRPAVLSDDVPTDSGEVAVSASSARSPAPAAQASSVLDGDYRTAWSPAFDDRTPRLSFTFSAPTTVDEVVLRTRGQWEREVSPLVRLTIGGREYSQRLAGDGVVRIPATTGEGLTLEFVAIDQKSSLGGLELEEVTISGVRTAVPSADAVSKCGSGPDVLVNGQTIPTRASVSRDGRLGLAPATWQACEMVHLTGTDDVVAVPSWNGFVPDVTTLTQDDARASQPISGVVGATSNGLHFAGEVQQADRMRVIVMTQNANPGWHATLDDEVLTSQVVDGRRQGFIVPAGKDGALAVSFSPDRWYRGVLLGGALGGVLLLLTAAMTLVRGRGGASNLVRTTPADGHVTSRATTTLVALCVGGVLAGPVGLAAVATGVGIASLVRQTTRMAVAGALVVAAGISQAVVSPASLGPWWLELSVRGVLLVAVGAAWASSQASSESRSRELDELVAEER